MPTVVDPVLAKALLGDDLAALAEAEEQSVVELRHRAGPRRKSATYLDGPASR